LIEKGEVFGTVEAVKTVSDLFMPLSGTVIELNPNLEDNPELINDDAYGAGWMIKIRVTGEDAGQNELLTADEYKEIVGA